MIYTQAGGEDKGRVERKKKGLLRGGRWDGCHFSGGQWDAGTFYSSI